MSETIEKWAHAHARIAAATCGHGQNDARYIMGDNEDQLLAVTHEEGSPVFSIYSTFVDRGDVDELHISVEIAAKLAAFFHEFGAGAGP